MIAYSYSYRFIRIQSRHCINKVGSNALAPKFLCEEFGGVVEILETSFLLSRFKSTLAITPSNEVGI